MGRWPVHPIPYSDESLSSWLDRIARAYGYIRDDLLKYDLGFDSPSSIKLDVNPPKRLLTELSIRTGVSVDQMRTMTVQGWEPLLIDGFDLNSSCFPVYAGGHSILYPTSFRPLDEVKDWIPWLNISSGIMQGCHICLQEKPEPYRRISWRMAWMMTCPIHGVMLEDMYWVGGEELGLSEEKPLVAPPELTELDQLTFQAVEKGFVSLPRRDVHGGVWVRLLRALIDELSLPASRLKRYRRNIVNVWKKLNLGVRAGVRIKRIPFEMREREQQILLMKAAGAAIQIIKEQQFKKAGDDAIFFQPLPINPEDLPSVPLAQPLPTVPKDFSSVPQYNPIWTEIKRLVKELEDLIRSDPKEAETVRNFLLGPNPSDEKIKDIEKLYRDLGVPKKVI